MKDKDGRPIYTHPWFCHTDDADHYASEAAKRALQRPAFSKWDNLRQRGRRKGDCSGRYLSDFITDGPLSDTTVGDILDE